MGSRYADVIVHRLLDASLGAEHESALLTHEDVTAIAANCNTRKQAAKKAQEESQSLFLWAFMAKTGELTEEAVVIDVLDYRQARVNGARHDSAQL